jgi:hypothetical protein
LCQAEELGPCGGWIALPYKSADQQPKTLAEFRWVDAQKATNCEQRNERNPRHDFDIESVSLETVNNLGDPRPKLIQMTVFLFTQK